MQPLIVPGTLDSLQTIAGHVMAVAAGAGLDKKTAYNLRLAVDEIATNIALYGYERAGISGQIEVKTEITDHELILTLEDTAAPYDPGNTPDPDFSLPLDERPIGGLGVYLAMNGVDDFRYERVNDRNRNIFVVKLAPVGQY